jgi:hypothetical protein
LCLGFFEFVHSVRSRGKALLGYSMELLVTPRIPGPGFPDSRMRLYCLLFGDMRGMISVLLSTRFI